MNSHAYQAYKSVQVTTASQGNLLLMLFDGAIKFAGQAITFIEELDFAQANDKLLRSQDIMDELMTSLNMEAGEISNNLYQLYTFIEGLLIEANIHKNVEVLEQAIRLLKDLRDMWRQVVENT